jgi:RNA polymerase sigma-70 factor, ECF subfamily
VLIARSRDRPIGMVRDMAHLRDVNGVFDTAVRGSDDIAVTDLPEVTDAQLIVASCRDPDAFCTLYDRWAEKLLAFFYRRVFDAEVAVDLLAETFAVAFERRGRYRDTGQPGAAWLYGIASKELARWFRRQEVERKALRRLGIAVPELDDESIARIEALADRDAQRATLNAALARMTDNERDAVRLRVLDELGYAEIAAKLGCTEGAARNRVYRGLARLSTLLEVTT